ncbi:bifunctional uridylyltransferase/uridylyl-removing protein GlnD [Caviibacterium pharyngocola]|uniref:Bifunctional uridylyltransferase/uridylyl-removing enzyme n=1 Tax=Caviibacterium pharyngocola TaxID=28159 RepID=A0A2M8RZ86_9PAST|nr:bifunctional uridylyltransferase/uridylyl-removing protein GlnD [Caviibacterium pharyngocola]PJG84201.1 [protein-PII] uridylyltransferase [Caviibacterium pharyngocola]
MIQYIRVAEPTPASIKLQKNQLKQAEAEGFAQTSVYDLLTVRTRFCDDLLIHLWQHFGLDQNPLFSLIAVGGYGREEMFPLSDLDFLILTDTPPDAEAEDKIRQFVQFLWDCGFDVGHSVRTLAQCEEEGMRDISIATNLLESRYLCGDIKSFGKLTALLQSERFWSLNDFFNAKIQEKAERYQRYNNTGYNLEPDIKYSPGGLRDLHLLYWLALRHTGAKNLDAILQTGFIYPEEYRLLQESQEFLFKVRFALHLILRRYDNRLLFDRQLKVSELLGYQGEGNQAVEKMMKAFFQALQSISSLANILTKHYREHFLTVTDVDSIVRLDENFSLVNNEIYLTQGDCFLHQPDSILDLFFHLTAQPTAEIHSATLRKLHLVLKNFQGYLCDIPSAREKFLRLLSQPNAVRRAFVPMHQYGVLSIYLPQWKGIEGLMQFDLFHSYTVDEHTLRVMLKLESFLQPESLPAHPICAAIFPQLSDRTLVYLAALFHDIAKGRGGDHAELGAQDIRRFAEIHGFDYSQAETMAWLVEKHLLMSVTAQRRDIHDPNVVMTFAAEVRDQVRLDFLTCLTVADICATNETLWNSWKRSLLATLYQYTELQFRQGMNHLLDNHKKIAEHREQALNLLQREYPLLDKKDILRLWKRCPDDYFLRNTPKQIAWHTQLLSESDDDVLVKISNRFSLGGTEVFIYCKDQANLFNKVVSAIGAKQFSIHDAQIITSSDGYVFDSFIVTELNGELAKFERRRSLEEGLTQALRSDKLPELNLSKNRQLQHFQVKTDVRFLNTEKTDQTEMELFALDKAGLLAEVGRIFSGLELNLLNAKITTIGEKAEDFFILTNKNGTALDEAERASLKQNLLDYL